MPVLHFYTFELNTTSRAQVHTAGWSVARQAGSHVMMVKPHYLYTLSIPQHKELGVGLVQKPIKQAGITVEQFDAF